MMLRSRENNRAVTVDLIQNIPNPQVFQTWRQTIYILCLFFLNQIARPGLVAQDLGIHMMSRDQVFLGRNPAIPFSKNTIIGLPEGSGILDLQAGKGDWLVSQKDGSRKISLADGWEGLGQETYQVGVSWRLRSFFIGKKFNRFQLGISHELEGNSLIGFNRDLAGILAFGNYGYLQKQPLAKEQPLDLEIDVKNEIFNGFGIQLGYLFNRVSIGGSLRYLSGLQELHTEVNQLELDIRDPLSITSREDWKVYSANLVNEINLDSIQFIPFTDLNILGRHPGFSGSIGIAYQSPEVLLALQWKDIGSIRWKDGTLFSRKGTINYSGISVPNLLTLDPNVFNSIGDTLRKLVSVDKMVSQYRSQLRSNILAEFQYYFLNKWNLGSAINYYLDRRWWQVMAGVNYQLFEQLSLGSQGSYNASGRFNIGLHAALRLAAFNLYLNTDHIQSLYPTTNLNQFSARVGISLMW
ncbi:MAG: DUF5723 family protein [Saprospiraceae bacterium]|nr:DUF5723 family protein [Saprospiraceae bacterium]